MKTTHKIKMDLVRQGIPPRVSVVQGDAYSRQLEIGLYADKRPWKVPENAQVIIRYRKPDRTSGSYDTLADGTSAVAVSGNLVSILIAPEALSIAGTVVLMVTILLGQQQLSTFSIDLVVQPNCVTDWNDTEQAAWIAAFLPSPEDATPGQYLTVGDVDEKGHVIRVTSGDAPGISEDTLHDAIDQRLQNIDFTGPAGADGGYYTPGLQTPDAQELLFSFTPSREDMPSINPVTVRLPEGPQGEKGEKGDPGEKGEKGDPGEAGQNGADGLTPFIGSNGNWWIGTADTGVSASGSGASGLPAVTAADNGKFMRVVDGAWAASAPRSILLEDTEFDGFAMDDYYGAMIYNLNTSLLTLELGETYIVNWDGIEYPCAAVSAAPMGIDGLALGKASIGGIEGGNEDAPFVIGWSTAGATLFALDDATSHTVGIYREEPYATESFVKTYVAQYISEALGGDY